MYAPSVDAARALLAVVAEAREAIDRDEMAMVKESEEMIRLHERRREETRFHWEARVRGAEFDLQHPRGPKSK
jgi:hypothetical protein